MPIPKDQLRDAVISEYRASLADSLSVDELLLNPYTAAQFCKRVRKALLINHLQLPDPEILRTLITARKSGKVKMEH